MAVLMIFYTISDPPGVALDLYNNLKKHSALYDFIPFENLLNESNLEDLIDFRSGFQ